MSLHPRAAGCSAAFLLAAALAACSPAPTRSPPPPVAEEEAPRQPEAATGLAGGAIEQRVWPGWAVASAHPAASDAGAAMLRAGGNAVDAAIAVQMVLALVEPQSSGIGGGAFLLHWNGQGLQAWDGRETAPAAANERLFLDAAGRPLPMDSAVNGGRAVGTPGAVRMLEAVHRAHGRLPWSRLFEPAIALAENGFVVGPRLAALLRGPDGRALRDDPRAAAYFFDSDGVPVAAGTRLRNPALAAVLRRLAREGSAALHSGPVAADIVRRVRQHAVNPGRLAESDLAAYRPRQRDPLCTPWRRAYVVCGFPPPSSGHITTMQIVGLLDAWPEAPIPLRGGLPSPAFLHRYAEASRLAFADRALYVADPDFAPPPAGRWESLLDESYLADRAGLLSDQGSIGIATAGVPQRRAAGSSFAPSQEQAEHGTSHVSVVDAQGHAVAMTTTIEAAFGSRVMSDGGTGLAGGFLLNNELTDFAFVPRDAAGRPVANRVQPGKRPRSSMGPTMVFDHPSGQLRLVMGSPGGAAIIHYNAKTLLGTLAWGLSPQQALDLPNFANDNGVTRLETGRFPEVTQAGLRSRGQRVIEQDLTSGSQVLLRVEGGWLGGTDRRREGAVVGE
jgi:gamma-glutamyltranspeptidase/glutathione hydrolase